MSCSPIGLATQPLPSLELLNVRAGIGHARESDPREDRIVAELATDGSAVTLLLARRVALLATRLERSSRHEVVATATRVRQATTDFAAARQVEAQRRFDAVATDPGQRAALLDLPEGVDLMLATLRNLRPRAGAAAPGTWTDADDRELTRCLGAGTDAPGTPATHGADGPGRRHRRGAGTPRGAPTDARPGGGRVRSRRGGRRRARRHRPGNAAGSQVRGGHRAGAVSCPQGDPRGSATAPPPSAGGRGGRPGPEPRHHAQPPRPACRRRRASRVGFVWGRATAGPPTAARRRDHRRAPEPSAASRASWIASNAPACRPDGP